MEACAESFLIAENGVIVFANRAFATMFGYEHGTDAQGRSLAEFVPGNRACTFHNSQSSRSGTNGCGYPGCDFSGTRTNGSTIRLQASCSDFRLDERELVVISLHDVGQGERRRVLRASDKRFQSIFDAAAIGMVQCTTDGRVVESNPAMARLLGYSRAELRNRYLREFIHPDDLAAELDLLQELAEGRRDSCQMELRYLSRNKSTGWARLTASLVRGPDHVPEFVIAMLEDVTEGKRAERRLRESQQMEAIGRLVGGVAHDFNNLLTGIMLYCDLLRAGLQNNQMRHHADEIRMATEQGAALIQQLLAVARQQVVEAQVLSLNSTIRGMRNLLSRLIGEDIEIVTELCDELRPVRMDPAQAQQIVLNLVLNARDAMPEGGKIIVATRNRPEEPGYVELKVTDTGCGMDSETRSHLFEPFFTTKGPGRGNGLGLATVHSIVKQDGGSIDVESSVGRGTQVTICLPGLNLEPHSSESPASPEEPVEKASETVLLVEDETAVREAMGRILTHEGYTVVEARNASEALIACRNHHGEIDLLISDIVLPGMGGHQVAQRVRLLRPKVRVLFTSGYNREAIAKADRNKVLFFRKPFTGDALLKRVREILNEPSPRSETEREEDTP